jgi:hypothetical protein
MFKKMYVKNCEAATEKAVVLEKIESKKRPSLKLIEANK